MLEFCFLSRISPSGFRFFFFFQAEDGIRDLYVTGVQTCALPICGVEARHGGHAGQQLLSSFDACQCARLVQWRKIGQLVDADQHRGVDHNSLAEPAAAMDDAMPEYGPVPVTSKKIPELGMVRSAVPRIKLNGAGDSVRAVEQAQLEAGRAG